MSINYNGKSSEFLTQDELDVYTEDVLKKMTLKDKMNQITGNWSQLKFVLDGMTIKNFKFGFRYNNLPYPAGGYEPMGIEPMKFVDGPRGVVSGQSTCFPVAIGRGATFDPELERQVGLAIGAEVRANDGNYFGGVCINLLRHPAWGRAQETYSEDTYLLGEFGAALTQGVQEHKVMACVKHYALNSMENARFKVNVEIDERSLREIYLPHFKKCLDAGAASVMGAYNLFRQHRCCESDYLLNKILRDEWGFKGFVISDFIFGIKDAKKALQAGLDIEMPYKFKFKALDKAVKKGEVSETVVEEAARRVIRTLIQFTPTSKDRKYDKNLLACKEHVKLAKEVAEKSMVLLKNETNILPFSVKDTKTIAVIGKLADYENIGDHGSSRVRPPYIVKPLQAIKKFTDFDIVFNDGENIEEAVRIAQKADKVVFVAGYNFEHEGEKVTEKGNLGGDRTNLGLLESDVLLLRRLSKVNEQMVTVLIGGSAITTSNIEDYTKGIIMAWYPGMEGGTAIANVLFGRINPSGKLPITIPKDESQLPYFDKDAAEITYDYYHGYLLADKENYDVAYPFGFGLSYTTFELKHTNVQLLNEVIKVSLQLYNTGNMDGEEVVQVYIGARDSKVERHYKELKAFKKVFVNKGKHENVTLEVPINDLAYYDEKAADWQIEATTYQVYVGASSDNQMLNVFEINLNK